MIPKCPVTGKHCYTNAAAKKAAAHARRQTLGARISTYRCDDHDKHPEGAGRFHIGHSPKHKGKFKVKPL